MGLEPISPVLANRSGNWHSHFPIDPALVPIKLSPTAGTRVWSLTTSPSVAKARGKKQVLVVFGLFLGVDFYFSRLTATLRPSTFFLEAQHFVESRRSILAIGGIG